MSRLVWPLDLTTGSLILFCAKQGMRTLREQTESKAVTQTGRTHKNSTNNRDCPPRTRSTPRRVATQSFLPVVLNYFSIRHIFHPSALPIRSRASGDSSEPLAAVNAFKHVLTPGRLLLTDPSQSSTPWSLGLFLLVSFSVVRPCERRRRFKRKRR